MNILFLTLIDIQSIEERNIYTDLLREFRKQGSHVYIASPSERRTGEKTRLISENGVTILKIKTGNLQKSGYIEKGISTCLIETQFIRGIRRYYAGVRFDLVLYSTPPITFYGPIRYIKQRDNAFTYLLLKDIFPQNAVDLGVLGHKGPGHWLCAYFTKKEKRLYAVSDQIGCMSEANVEYLLSHNPSVSRQKAEVCPNTITPSAGARQAEPERRHIRKTYGLPEDKNIFIYGGNLGKPQGIPFLMECIKENEKEEHSFILVVGSGTEYPGLCDFFKREKPRHAKLIRHMEKAAYERLLSACDVGLIFLNACFTIPNFPSRLLSYMDAGLPVLAATDRNTDIGDVIEKGRFGKWCESVDAKEYIRLQRIFSDAGFRKECGENARKYLEEHYTSKKGYRIIMDSISNRSKVI